MQMNLKSMGIIYKNLFIKFEGVSKTVAPNELNKCQYNQYQIYIPTK